MEKDEQLFPREGLPRDLNKEEGEGVFEERRLQTFGIFFFASVVVDIT